MPEEKKKSEEERAKNYNWSKDAPFEIEEEGEGEPLIGDGE